ncbi:alpha/beta fold hydrolase [Limobrevibacterium gyesilva]|uniref:Alpha/beta fold hydrolase n=1 Tax=Limobrevibacterium gyesilva TaxID=2991712 RepID=A0AA42CHD3_9PROT|nr:alpha/beta fold hydrolase [Limobrevibacterium gyesilva]MCW3477136.1 alpha/beta fold hydrolase [Limobrevibacterium gyesilva]
MILHTVEKGEGRPLALLHGLFGQAANFGTVQKMLAAKYRVLALDLRNHGASPHAPRMSYPGMAEDVLETLRQHAALPCALAGHSMGGKVAMAAAIEAPAAIERLLVADIAPVRYPPAFRAFAQAMQAIRLRPDLSRAEADAALADVVEVPAVRAFLLQNLRFGAAPAWKIGLAEIAAALADIEGWPELEGPSYPGPALFVAGTRSEYIRPEHRPMIRRLFPAARFATLKDAGHWLHADNPDGFVAVVDTFMA